MQNHYEGKITNIEEYCETINGFMVLFFDGLLFREVIAFFVIYLNIKISVIINEANDRQVKDYFSSLAFIQKESI